MSSPNRKRSKITLETKKKIIDVSANQNSTELGKQFELPPSTIRRILQNKRSILNALEQGNEAKRIVLRPVKHEKEAMEGDLAEYLAVDQDVVIGGDLTFTEIAQIFSGSTQVNEEDNEGDEDVTEIEDTTPPVTLREAYDSLNILQRYVDQNPGEGRMKKCDALEDILFEDRAKNLKQKKLFDYFSPHK
uniref:HTH psq-type domain-containing protein n=1 Tax=Meloidogyne hapla TaxID=6305 RepID=A0A1I8BYZ2_MELHA